MEALHSHSLHTPLLSSSTISEEALEAIGQSALRLAEQRYSSGFPAFKGGRIRKLGFNNRRHGEMVGSQAAELAEFTGLSTLEHQLVRTAGFAHDIVQLKGRKIDEEESAQWLREQLSRAGMPSEIIVMMSEAILATLPLFTDGIVSDQMVNHMKFSSKRAHQLALCVASADMGEIYTPTGPYLGHLLYVQRQGVNADQPPLHVDDLLDFQRRQCLFLDRYTYPLAAASSLFTARKKEVMEYGAFVLKQLEDGKIESWDQLLRQDMAFMRTPEKEPAFLLSQG